MKIVEVKDIYLTKNYAELYEDKEKGTAEVFDFVSPFGKAQNIFLKRKVPFLIDGQEYYDISTPYGYGGPIILETTNLELLLKGYFQAFHEYCLKEQIVSEFVRFHLFENQEFREYFDGEIELIGKHIVRNLKKPIKENLHKGVLQAVRRANRLKVEVIFDHSGQYIDDFLKIYDSTMDLHEASSFYYFSKAFFEQIHETLTGHYLYVHALLEGKIIASRLILFGGKYAYYFLGGALREYSTYKAAVLLDYEIMKYLQQEGKEYYIFGGGYRGEDSLYKYKMKFSQQGQIPFYIGKKVHYETIYNQLAEVRSLEGKFDPKTSFFPSYRS